MRRDAVVGAALMGAALVMAAAANGHQARSGWSYDYPECCWGRECAEVPSGVVREVQGGYAVRVVPGQHPMLTAGAAIEGFVPHGDARIRVSQDSERHVCIVYGRIGCIYVPPGGV